MSARAVAGAANGRAGRATGACHRQRGVSMVEALVSILIVSMGILALAGLLATSGRLAKTSEFRATATLLAADMADRLRANPLGASDGDYALAPTALASDLPASAADCTMTSVCSPSQLANKDIADWQATVYSNLPSGTGYILMDAANADDRMADLWIMWREAKADDATNQAAVSGLGFSECPPGFSATDGTSCMYFRVGR